MLYEGEIYVLTYCQYLIELLSTSPEHMAIYIDVSFLQGLTGYAFDCDGQGFTYYLLSFN
jgi:energy-converting hydrogenase Eha subunit G